MSEFGEWYPIETAPQRPWKFVLLCWGGNDDPTTGMGCFRDGEWIAAGVFYQLGKPRDSWQFREITVYPTHWMPLPKAMREDDHD